MRIMDIANKLYDVCVIGGVGIDTNIFLYGKDIDFDIEVNFSQNEDYIGNPGGYCSRGINKLGKKTMFLGYIGNDFFGQHIRDSFIREGIDTECFIDPVGTICSINFMYTDGRRKNFYDGKTSMTVRPDLEICKSVLSKTTLAHFSIVNWTRYLLPLAKKAGVIISCDIQDIPHINDEYRKDYIKYADILFMSSANLKNTTDIQYTIKNILDLNSSCIVVVGMSEKGCALGTKDGITFYPIVNYSEPIVDTNGAGDSLVTGFLTSYIFDGFNLEESILRGQISARYKCSQKATSSNLITQEKLEELYKSYF